LSETKNPVTSIVTDLAKINGALCYKQLVVNAKATPTKIPKCGFLNTTGIRFTGILIGKK
jgi:hypothetical protein